MANSSTGSFVSALTSGALKQPSSTPGGITQQLGAGLYSAGGDPLNAAAKQSISQSQANMPHDTAAQLNAQYAPPTTTNNQPTVDSSWQQFMNSQNAQLNQNAAIDKQIQAMIQAQAPGVAPTLNINAINSSAQAAANSQVNPLYTQQLNEYLQNEASAQAEQQKQNELNIAGYQSGLQNTLAQNTQAQQFAGQQNELQQGNINAEAANYQLNSGDAQNQKVAALQSAQGSGGLAGSGMGAQQIWEAENAKNVADAQQQGQFQYNRDVANLTTSNTFAQLGQSSAFAKTQEGQQEAQSNFSLNSYLRQSAYQQQQYQNALQQWKQTALTAATQNSVAGQVSQQLQNMNLSDKNAAAAQQRYGQQLAGAGSSGPALVNQGSYQP